MGNKVKMAEVHNLHDSVSNALNKLSTQTSTLKTNIENLKGDDNFKGQTANSINYYNQNFHIETINRLDKIKEEFETKFKSAMDAFHADVDNDHSAILNKNAMETYKDEIDQSVFLVLGAIGLIIPAKFIAFQWIIKYADFKIVVLDEK
ncbi:T7SS effector LXG polymorphic toxin [Staphylococcus xylosus]|uniref:T7SS effector LXG polymorphic toxin n=1 Tax=Staphylococcus xylosus TaxID=1288 RepID=UPI000D1D432F|nr:T7SS effector LXG polymorphic toxin [Staphylococcus xylosus]PTH99438.1 hypothetical protein BU099_04625 [Staphylococcus xylosus]